MVRYSAVADTECPPFFLGGGDLRNVRNASKQKFSGLLVRNLCIELIHRKRVALGVHLFVTLIAHAPDNPFIGKPRDEALAKVL